jgi:hypothetical protein
MDARTLKRQRIDASNDNQSSTILAPKFVSKDLAQKEAQYCENHMCCVCNKVLGGSMEQTHQFEYIKLYVEINLSIPQ